MALKTKYKIQGTGCFVLETNYKRHGTVDLALWTKYKRQMTGEKKIRMGVGS